MAVKGVIIILAKVIRAASIWGMVSAAMGEESSSVAAKIRKGANKITDVTNIGLEICLESLGQIINLIRIMGHLLRRTVTARVLNLVWNSH